MNVLLKRLGLITCYELWQYILCTKTRLKINNYFQSFNQFWCWICELWVIPYYTVAYRYVDFRNVDIRPRAFGLYINFPIKIWKASLNGSADIILESIQGISANVHTSNISIWKYHYLGEVAFLKIFEINIDYRLIQCISKRFLFTSPVHLQT